MTPGQRDAYQRALDDQEFRSAVEDHYRGSRDVLDALWWRAHPDQASPQGAPAPSGRVRALQRRVFAADADAAGDDAVHRALRELQAEIAGERAAIDDAVRAAEQDGALAHDGALVEDADGPPAAAEKPAGASRNRGRLAAGLIVAAVLGGVVGAQIVGVTTRGTETPAAATTPIAALEIFDRPQTAEDVPAIALPASFQPLTLRSLGSLGWDLVDPPVVTPYYVVRADADRLCLLLMTDEEHYVSSCASETEFAASELILYWTDERGLPSDGLAPGSGPPTWFVTWSPDGGVGVGPASADDVR